MTRSDMSFRKTILAAALALGGTLAITSASEAMPRHGGGHGGGHGHHGGGWGHHGGHGGGWGHRPWRGHGWGGGYGHYAGGYGGCRMVRQVIHGYAGPYVTYKRVCYIF